MAATTSYKARIIVKEHTGDDFAGSYKLLLKAKSMPAPVSSPNLVETTTYEDDTQTFVEGIKTNDQKTVTGNLEKEYLAAIEALKGKQVDVMQLYGTDGIGGVAKYAYVGQVTATPTDMSGVDSVLEMEATVTPNTASILCTDDYTVVDNGDGTFTVTSAGA